MSERIVATTWTGTAEQREEFERWTAPPPEPDNGSRWLDANGLAEHLGLSPKTVQNLSGPSMNGNGIPFHRLTPNGEKRFNVEEVDAWLLARVYARANDNGAASDDNGPAPRTPGGTPDASEAV
jgi:hypothetical protein